LYKKDKRGRYKNEGALALLRRRARMGGEREIDTKLEAPSIRKVVLGLSRRRPSTPGAREEQERKRRSSEDLSST